MLELRCMLSFRITPSMGTNRRTSLWCEPLGHKYSPLEKENHGLGCTCHEHTTTDTSIWEMRWLRWVFSLEVLLPGWQERKSRTKCPMTCSVKSGTRETDTQNSERENECHTCFQFSLNWNSVPNNGRLCETEGKRKTKMMGSRMFVIVMFECVTIYIRFVRSHVLQKRFYWRLKTLVWWCFTWRNLVQY